MLKGFLWMSLKLLIIKLSKERHLVIFFKVRFRCNKFLQQNKVVMEWNYFPDSVCIKHAIIQNKEVATSTIALNRY